MQVGGFEIPIDLDADDATFEKAFASLPAIAEVAAKLEQDGPFACSWRQNRLPYHEFLRSFERELTNCEAMESAFHSGWHILFGCHRKIERKAISVRQGC